MKILLVLAAALGLAAAAHAQDSQSGSAQNSAGQSDSYVCYHGAADDPNTDAACARIQAAASQPVKPTERPVAGAQSQMTPPANPAASGPIAANPAPASPATSSPAAAPAPTDVGEAPLNATPENAGDEANADSSTADISAHGSWLAGLGAFAVVIIAIALFSGLAVYFIPTMIAMARRKRNTLAIFALNLFLGWSFVGWVAALIWSLATDPQGR